MGLSMAGLGLSTGAELGVESLSDALWCAGGASPDVGVVAVHGGRACMWDADSGTVLALALTLASTMA